jgi:hypothetical protein
MEPTQYQVKHAAGELPACPCGHSPKHIHDRRAAHSNGGHFLECCPCDRRTPRSASLAGAVDDWCRITGAARPGQRAMTPVSLLRIGSQS